jgi:hypothetical protein
MCERQAETAFTPPSPRWRPGSLIWSVRSRLGRGSAGPWPSHTRTSSRWRDRDAGASGRNACRPASAWSPYERLALLGYTCHSGRNLIDSAPGLGPDLVLLRRSAPPHEGGRLMAMRVISVVPIDSMAFVGCAYCTTSIPALEFEYPYWTAAQRLLSAWCPGCHLRVSISAKSWRRASGLSQVAAF